MEIEKYIQYRVVRQPNNKGFLICFSVQPFVL